jgi:hypothetical protein
MSTLGLAELLIVAAEAFDPLDTRRDTPTTRITTIDIRAAQVRAFMNVASRC